MKKKLIAIFFLLILFAPFATIYTYLQFEKSNIRRTIKWKMIAGINPEELVLLKFSKEETQTKLRWEHSKEFEYNGQMYDIVSKEVKGDSIFYRCWWDYDETKLNKKLKSLVANAFNKSENNQMTHFNLQHYLSSLFCPELFSWEAKLPEYLRVKHQNNKHFENFTTLLLSPPTPPPKIG